MPKVLVVEDDALKLRHVISALTKVDGCSPNMVDNVRDLVGAKRALRETRYDLMILDIAVPPRADQEPIPTAGISLLDELNEREHIYNVPQHIIGLTAHDDVLRMADSHFAKDLWSVIRYDATSVDWEEPIQRRFRHIVQASRSSAGAAPTSHLTITQLIHAGEADTVEFKSTLRYNIKAGKDDQAIELAALKTMAAFMNTVGGTLLIGVSNDGQVVGIRDDHFANSDKACLHLTSLVKDRISAAHMRFVTVSVENVVDGKQVMRVDCSKAEMPAYVRTDRGESFYIRTGPATTDLQVSKVHDYVSRWFPR
jgi:CheY-like chemotaxis protein